MTETINGKGQILPGHVFVYPKGEHIEMPDLLSFMRRNIQYSKNYAENMRLYTGDHEILHKQPNLVGPDNRLVVNLPHYIVDTYNGFFSGIPAKITLNDSTDEENQGLQNWNDTNSIQDKLNEISKQVDVYGRAFAFAYQNENSETKVAYASPMEAFMVYDDTVAQEPLAFVRYWKDVTSGMWCGSVYYADGVDDFKGSDLESETQTNPYGLVPAVEFFANTERQGIFDNVKTLIDALNKVMSQKSNQVEYFDQAYLKMLGLDLDNDGDGKPDIDLVNNRVIYSPDASAKDAVIDFIAKPDGDTMQEHMIDRLIKMIHQVAMVPDLNDEAFASNSSGVAMQYKLLSMRNMAATKERKFRYSLRQLYRIIFSVGTVVHDQDAWQRLAVDMKRNLPDNLSEEAQTASTLSNIVSKRTQLKVLSIVDDPDREIKQMQDEQAETTRLAREAADAMPDFLKDGEEDGNKSVLDTKEEEGAGVDQAKSRQR